MAKNKAKAAGKVADAATESARMRALRIDGSQNGATLRTRVVRDKTKYNRNLKHKKSLADAGSDAGVSASQSAYGAKRPRPFLAASIGAIFLRHTHI